MAQYIDKSAVVAELERLKEGNYKICAGDFDFLKKVYPKHYYSTEIYNDIFSFLDTLEVKDVNSEFLKKHFEETPQEELDKEWKEIEPLNDIGPDVLEYADKIKNG